MQPGLSTGALGKMQIDAEGHLKHARFVSSPNFDERLRVCVITLLVIHNISLPPDDFTGDGVIELFTNTLDPEAHPYYQRLGGLKVLNHFFHPAKRGNHSVRLLRKAGLACRGVPLRGQEPLQRLFDWYRA